MKWFRHDSNANSDYKMKKLRHKYGLTGYGLYWYCVELVAANLDARNVTFQLEECADVIAIDWNIEESEIREIMQYMVSLKLFETENGRIFCRKLIKRLDESTSRNPEIMKICKSISANVEDDIRESFGKESGESPEQPPNDYEQKRREEIRKEENRTEENRKEKSKEKEKEKEKNEKKEKERKTREEKCGFQPHVILTAFAEVLPEYPQVLKIDPKQERYRLMLNRWEENEHHRNIEFWRWFFFAVREDDFLMCRKGSFKMKIQSLLRPDMFADLVETQKQRDDNEDG